jgi:hypothetical protein
MWAVIIFFVALAVLFCLCVCVSNAEEVEAHMLYDKYWKLLITEAGGEGKPGMYAVACVVRNRLQRGMSDGLVSALRPDFNDFIARQESSTIRDAKDVCHQVFVRAAVDITKGATHFENVKRYGYPKWAKHMKTTTVIGNHTFFK